MFTEEHMYICIYVLTKTHTEDLEVHAWGYHLWDFGWEYRKDKFTVYTSVPFDIFTKSISLLFLKYS